LLSNREGYATRIP